MCTGYMQILYHLMGFPGGLDGKELPHNAGVLGFIPGSGRRPGRGHGNLLQYSCLENPHGQRSLAGYSPRGHKELDMTKTTKYNNTILCKGLEQLRIQIFGVADVGINTLQMPMDGCTYLSVGCLSVMELTSLKCRFYVHRNFDFFPAAPPLLLRTVIGT